MTLSEKSNVFSGFDNRINPGYVGECATASVARSRYELFGLTESCPRTMLFIVSVSQMEKDLAENLRTDGYTVTSGTQLA